MANSELIKSKQYKGVYWRQIEKSDGHGTERMYYIIYRRGGRDSKLIKEPIGKTSTGMTEARANIERGKRISGEVLPNTEKREQAAKDKLTGGNLTFERLWELYRQAKADKACIKGDTFRYNLHIAGRLAKKEIPVIETADLEYIRKTMEKKGLSAQTVKHALGLVRRVMRHGVKLGICSMPGKLYFEMPTVDNQKTENMDAEQLAAYWQALDEEPDQDAAAFLKIALLTGMRKGALMGLQWRDIDFDMGFITLPGEHAKNEKTAKIPLNDAAMSILQSISRTSEYVFPGRNGGHRKEYKRISQRVRNKAGLPPDFRPCHGLRHTFASHLASSGKVDLYTLQKLLTHSSPQMTQRYAHLADEAMQRAASVANILADPNKTRD